MGSVGFTIRSGTRFEDRMKLVNFVVISMSMKRD